MSIRSIATLLAALACGVVVAASDVGVKPPSQPVTPATEKLGSPRCAPQVVNECRTACDAKKSEPAAPPPEVAKKSQECKQACIQGC